MSVLHRRRISTSNIHTRRPRNFAASRDWDGSHPRPPAGRPFRTALHVSTRKARRSLVANLAGCQQCRHDALIVPTDPSVRLAQEYDMGSHLQLEAYPNSVNPAPATNANETVNVLPRKDRACLSTSSSRSPGSDLSMPVCDFSLAARSRKLKAAMYQKRLIERVCRRVGPFSQAAVPLERF